MMMAVGDADTNIHTRVFTHTLRKEKGNMYMCMDIFVLVCVSACCKPIYFSVYPVFVWM